MLRSIAVFLLWACALLAQRSTGELRIYVSDPSGLALAAHGALTGLATQVKRNFDADDEGRYIARNLPFGSYRIEIRRQGFITYTDVLEINSALPLERRIALALTPLDTQVVVTDSATLVDPHRTGGVQYVGRDSLRDRPSSTPGRSVLDAVSSQPGWLLEANGVLHPRGSEYATQYIVDGIPITDNRSPGFAPELEADDIQSLSVLTGNFPAEYGRKLGGVVEVNSRRDDRQGLHARASVGGGSFDTVTGSAGVQYSRGRDSVGISTDLSRTDRYLDPPVLQNFNNSGTAAGVAARGEHDFSDHDRLRISLARRQTRFLVPNELLQQTAGQRQDRSTEETSGQIAYQHIFSPRVLGDIRGMVRDLGTAYWSNPRSTPIAPSQNRGFREAYVNGSISVHAGDHELKAGAEGSFANLNEQFGYNITAYRIGTVRIFDRDTPATFRYSGSGRDREKSLFVQDLYRHGPLTLSAGLRFDHYKLVVDETAVSPRLGAAFHVRPAGLVLRASYDRVFQTPAMENLLLSSSQAVQALNNAGVFLPVRPSRGNFYEAGFTKSLGGKLRLDGQYFRRSMDNFGDDDVLLNTGVSFPIAFSHAVIHGFEAKVELPKWGPVSGFLSYSNLSGKAQLPVTGGLFLDDNASDLLRSTEKIPITQDQRNTAGGRMRSEVGKRAWVAFGAAYGSGLPIEDDGLSAAFVAQQYGAEILKRVNFNRGRVRPSFMLDASAGVKVVSNERWLAQVQADVFNLTDRVNVINFAGLFSGTAVARPRTATVRLALEF